MKRICQEQMPLIPEREIKTLQTLGQVLSTFSTDWENWGDIGDYLTYGGVQAKYNPDGQYFEIMELITPDAGVKGYSVQETGVYLSDIFEDDDSDILVNKLIPTKRAMNVATFAGAENDLDEGNVAGFISAVVHSWIAYYGGEETAFWEIDDINDDEEVEEVMNQVEEYLKSEGYDI